MAGFHCNGLLMTSKCGEEKDVAHEAIAKGFADFLMFLSQF